MEQMKLWPNTLATMSPEASRGQHEQAPTFRVKVLPGGQMPICGHGGGDAGFDLFTRAIVDPRKGYLGDGMTRISAQTLPCTLDPGHKVFVGLGIAIEMHSGYWAEVRPRSSTDMGLILVTNQCVPIDAGFRAEPVAHLWNTGPEGFPIVYGERLVQLIFFGGPKPRLVDLEPGESFAHDQRRNGSFGSTGR